MAPTTYYALRMSIEWEQERRSRGVRDPSSGRSAPRAAFRPSPGEEDGEESVIDAGIIVAAQKVEHYEIAGYGSVRTFAQLLGKDRSAELLQTTLDEESEANELLNNLAEDIVNPEALMEPELAGASSNR